jgi:hypothetical protein
MDVLHISLSLLSGFLCLCLWHLSHSNRREIKKLREAVGRLPEDRIRFATFVRKFFDDYELRHRIFHLEMEHHLEVLVTLEQGYQQAVAKADIPETQETFDEFIQRNYKDSMDGVN